MRTTPHQVMDDIPPVIPAEPIKFLDQSGITKKLFAQHSSNSSECIGLPLQTVFKEREVRA